MVIDRIYEHVKAKMRSNAYDLSTFMAETNIQANSENLGNRCLDEILVDKAIHEMRDDLAIGFRSAESQQEVLQAYCASAHDTATSKRESGPTRQEKYFFLQDEERVDVAHYSEHTVPKAIYILYSLYLQRQKLNDEDQKSFFDYVTRFLSLPKEEKASG